MRSNIIYPNICDDVKVGVFCQNSKNIFLAPQGICADFLVSHNYLSLSLTLPISLFLGLPRAHSKAPSVTDSERESGWVREREWERGNMDTYTCIYTIVREAILCVGSLLAQLIVLTALCSLVLILSHFFSLSHSLFSLAALSLSPSLTFLMHLVPFRLSLVPSTTIATIINNNTSGSHIDRDRRASLPRGSIRETHERVREKSKWEREKVSEEAFC